MFSPNVQPFSAMVLGAGLGTRLRPLSDEVPKPLLPVGDKSLLFSLIARLVKNGAHTVLVNAYHEAEQVVREVESFPFAVRVVVEETLLGTAGGIRNASPHFPRGNLVVQNGDIVGTSPELTLAGTVDPAGVILAVIPRDRGLGTVGIGAEGQVVRLRGEVFGVEESGADYIGAARLSEQAVRELPELGCLIGDYALPILRQGRRVGTVGIGGSFIDVGEPRTYLEANLAWLLAHTSPPHVFLGRGASVAPSVDARLCVISEGAEVKGEGLLERVVVLPHATAVGPLRDAIVTRKGRIIELGREGRGLGS